MNLFFINSNLLCGYSTNSLNNILKLYYICVIMYPLAHSTVFMFNYAHKLAEKNGFNNLKLVPNCIWDKAEELWFEKQ